MELDKKYKDRLESPKYEESSVESIDQQFLSNKVEVLKVNVEILSESAEI